MQEFAHFHGAKNTQAGRSGNCCRRLIDEKEDSSVASGPGLAGSYAAHGSFPVEVDRDVIESSGIEVVAGDLASTRDTHQRHDPGRLARTVYDWLDRRRSADQPAPEFHAARDGLVPLAVPRATPGDEFSHVVEASA